MQMGGNADIWGLMKIMVYAFSFHGSLLALVVLLVIGCGERNSSSSGPNIHIPEPEMYDPHSWARPDEARVTRLQLDLTVLFEEKVLEGIAIWDVDHDNAKEVILDTRDMEVSSVTIDSRSDPVAFQWGDEDPLLGRSLTIPLDPETEQVTVRYRTKPQAAALQWLSPEQTGQSSPFLYTQSQAILARSWLPCQDSPGIRFTFHARVKVPVGMMALMSASNPTMSSPDGIYVFSMDNPVPAYLMALAAGDIAYRPYGHRTGVYAQPDVLLSAAWEFEDTEKMMEAAENLYGPYQWERYDLLVLPPSFPFGGMENPRLTFLTPSVLAGDRSLTTIVAHELAHSWSGNLVTNATWNDFWLNEGFTVYFERRIMEALYGKELSEMLAVLGHQSLVQVMDAKGWDHPDTRLKLQLKGRNPDDALTRVAYEKGYLFLRTIESIYGREVLDRILQEWFRTHAFGAVTTEAFVTHLRRAIPDEASRLRIDEWVYGTGLPDNVDLPQSESFDRVDAALGKIASGQTLGTTDTAGWKAQMWLHFLRHLPAQADLAALDRQFEFSDSENAEYQAAWFEQTMKTPYGDKVLERLETFLKKHGRRKFLVPLYRSLKENGREKDALRIYTHARPGYHAVSRGTLDDLLGYKPVRD